MGTGGKHADVARMSHYFCDQAIARASIRQIPEAEQTYENQ
jgi:hypothetical protein